jgi:hypothetical protein
MGKICPPPQKSEKEAPVKIPLEQEIPLEPRLMGKICPQPQINETGNPKGPVIDS